MSLTPKAILNFYFKAASILKVSSLKNWITRSYAKTYFTKGLEALKVARIQFLYKNYSLSPEEKEEGDSSTASTATTAKYDNHFCKLFSQDLIDSPKSNK